MKKLLIILISCLLLASCTSKPSVKKQGPGELYVDGVNLMKQKKYDKAIVKFGEVTENYPFDPLALVAQVKLGDAQFERKDYVLAAGVYESFISAHPGDENAPYVIVRLGECYEHLSLSVDRDQANTLKAIEKYAFLKARYPRSSYAKVVDERLKRLEQRLADRELYVGEFYYRTSQYNASIVRLEYFLKKYPGAGGTDKAYFYLSMAYKELANPERSDFYSDKLRTEFPRSVYARSKIREKKTMKLAETSAPLAKPVDKDQLAAMTAPAAPTTTDAAGIPRKRLDPELERMKAAQVPPPPPPKAEPPKQDATTPATPAPPAAPSAAPPPPDSPPPVAETPSEPDPGTLQDSPRFVREGYDLPPPIEPSVAESARPDMPPPPKPGAPAVAAPSGQTAKYDRAEAGSSAAPKPRAIELTPQMYEEKKPDAQAKSDGPQAKQSAAPPEPVKETPKGKEASEASAVKAPDKPAEPAQAREPETIALPDVRTPDKPKAEVKTPEPSRVKATDITPSGEPVKLPEPAKTEQVAKAAAPQSAPPAASKGPAAVAPAKPANATGKAAQDNGKPKEADKDKKKDLDFFDKSKPIDIVSDTMEGFDKEKYVVFKGNVIAKQEDLYIFADTLEAFLNEESNEIDRAYAKDNVKIVKRERTATSNEAAFDNRKGEIVLKGNVVVYQAQDKLTGDVVTYYVNEDKAVVEADKEKGKRARVILTPKK